MQSPRQRRRKIIRSASWREWIMALPYDLNMILAERLARIDLEQVFSKMSLPIGIAFHATYFVLKWFRDGVLDDPDLIILTSSSSNPQHENPPLLYFIELILHCLSFTNAFVLFSWHVKRTLYKQPTCARYLGDTSWILKSRNAKLEQVEILQELKRKASDSEGEEAREIKKELRWVLHLWNPPRGCMTLLAVFGPPQGFMYFVMDQTNWQYLLPLIALSSMLWYATLTYIFERENDLKILQEQLLLEYSQFVYTLPPFRPTSSVAVGSEGADAFVEDEHLVAVRARKSWMNT